MTLYKDKFKTDSIRLKNWDYSSEAVYFITIVTKNRECLFGTIEDGKMILNEKGKIIETELLKSIKIRKNWFFHNWIIMSNHIHLLIEIQDSACIVETHSSASSSRISTKVNTNEFQNTTDIVETHSSACSSSISVTKNEIELKNGQTISTNIAETHSSAPLRDNRDEKKSESNLGRKPNSISSFVAIFKSITTKQINGSESIWQANYHDHIVRNYKRFEIIYSYIKNNPRSWETDSINSKF